MHGAQSRRGSGGSVPPPPSATPAKGKKSWSQFEPDTAKACKLPIVPGSRGPIPRATVSDAALTTVFKSDVMLLQLKSDKLERLWGAPSSDGKPTCDHEIKAILAQTLNVDAILAREKYTSVDEAVCMLSLKIGLNDLVDRKMQAIEKLVLQNTLLAPELSTTSTATLSRLPTFLALIDRLVQLHSVASQPPLEVDKSAASSHEANNASMPPPGPPKLPAGKEEALMGHIKQLQCELARATAEMQAKHRVAEDRWHREADVLKQECAAQNHTIAALQDDADAAKRALRRSAQELETATVKVELLQQECARHDSAMRDVLDEKQAMVTQLRDRQAMVVHWKTELDGFKERHEAQLAELHTQQAQKEAAHAADLQDAADRLAALEETTTELKALVTSLTEEDDALVQRIEQWVAVMDGGASPAELSVDIQGISGLKVAKALAFALQRAGHRLAALEGRVEEYTRHAASSTSQWEQGIAAIQDEIADAHAAIASLESLAQARLDTIEQLRVQLDEVNVQRAMKEATMTQSITSLNQEISCHLDSIDQLKKDKRELIQSQCNDAEVLAMDTYEEVLKQEFRTMKRAFELKAKQAVDQIETQERLHFKQVQDLVRKHKDDRIVEELKAKKVAHELRILQEKLKLIDARER